MDIELEMLNKQEEMQESCFKYIEHLKSKLKDSVKEQSSHYDYVQSWMFMKLGHQELLIEKLEKEMNNIEQIYKRLECYKKYLQMCKVSEDNLKIK